MEALLRDQACAALCREGSAGHCRPGAETLHPSAAAALSLRHRVPDGGMQQRQQPEPCSADGPAQGCCHHGRGMGHEGPCHSGVLDGTCGGWVSQVMLFCTLPASSTGLYAFSVLPGPTSELLRSCAAWQGMIALCRLSTCRRLDFCSER